MRRKNPDTAVYVYLNGNLMYEYNVSAETTLCMEDYEKQLICGMRKETVMIIPDAQKRCILSSFTLNDGVFQVVK